VKKALLSGLIWLVLLGGAAAQVQTNPYPIGTEGGSGGTASALATTANPVVVNTAPSPTVGQVLTATSPTAANWQTLTASASSITIGTTTILNGAPSCFLDNPTGTVSNCDPLGANVVSALGTDVGTAGSFVVFGGALGTPSSGTGTNLTNIPISTAISGLGANVATALSVAIGTNGSPVLLGGAGGTPSSLTLTNATGLPDSGIVVQTANTVMGAKAATSPIQLPMPSCSAATNALTWSTGNGFGCNTINGAVGANPTATAGPSVINGSATTFMRSDAAPPVQVGTSAQEGILQGDGATLKITAGTIAIDLTHANTWTNQTFVAPVLGTPASGTLTNMTGLPLGGITSQSANVIIGTIASGSPTALAIPSCQGGANALNWTTGTGFSCLTISGGSATAITVGTTTVGSGTPNGLLYDAAGVLGNLATANSGVLVTSSGGAPSIATTLPSGLSIPSPTVTGAFTATGLVTLADLATQATNTIVANVTSGSASPTAVSVGSCSAAGDALIWTTNTGPGCNTSITAAAAPLSGITGLGSNVATALAVNVGTAGAFVVLGGAGGTPSSLTLGLRGSEHRRRQRNRQQRQPDRHGHAVVFWCHERPDLDARIGLQLQHDQRQRRLNGREHDCRQRYHEWPAI
jgi:hypothetical protein